MKRVMIVCVLVVAAMAGCKKDKQGDSEKPADPTAPAGTPSTTPAKTDTPAPAGAGDTLAAKKTGIPECDEYFAAMDKFVACDKLPPEQKTAYAESAKKQRDGYLELKDDAGKATAADECKKALPDLKAGADARGCAM